MERRVSMLNTIKAEIFMGDKVSLIYGLKWFHRDLTSLYKTAF